MSLVRQLLQKQLPFNPKTLFFTNGGKDVPLENTHTLETYNIKDGDRLVTGAFHISNNSKQEIIILGLYHYYDEKATHFEIKTYKRITEF